MGLNLNDVVILTDDTWFSYLLDNQKFLLNSTSRVTLLAFINIPITAILLNVLRQLVSSKAPSPTL